MDNFRTYEECCTYATNELRKSGYVEQSKYFENYFTRELYEKFCNANKKSYSSIQIGVLEEPISRFVSENKINPDLYLKLHFELSKYASKMI